LLANDEFVISIEIAVKAHLRAVDPFVVLPCRSRPVAHLPHVSTDVVSVADHAMRTGLGGHR
jgi:hypothetical protein